MPECQPNGKTNRKVFVLILLSLLSLPGTNLAQDSIRQAKNITVLFMEDALPAAQKSLAQFTLSGESYKEPCAYYELLQKAKDTATLLGANLIKIVDRKNHSRTQNCDALNVAVFQVSKPQTYEKSFFWSVDRPLVWDDFEGKPRAGAGSNTVAETNCGIALETSLAGPLDDAKIYVFNTFDKTASWVKPEKRLPDILLHEQGHWDLCEIYTREMQRRFDALQIKGALMSETINHIYEEVTKEYVAKQQAYEEETQHGTVGDKQAMWTNRIRESLANNVTGEL